MHHHTSPAQPKRPALVAAVLLLVGLLATVLNPTAASAQDEAEPQPLPEGVVAATTEGFQASPETPDDVVMSSSEMRFNRRTQRPSRELAITEIMQNPSLAYDSVGEWFEVHNPNNFPVNMRGWTIGDFDNDVHQIPRDHHLIIEAGGYLVFGTNADQSTNGGVAVDYEYGASMRLYNSSDEIVIQNRRGFVAARVAWDDGVTFPDPSGASMALRTSWADGELAQHWCVSTTEYGIGDLGTPGRENTCDPAAPIVITEIMQNPDAVSDVNGEWFEVMNTGGGTVDLAGWTIKDDDGDHHVIGASVRVGPGERVVLARNGDPDSNGRIVADYAYGDSIRLHNSWDELVLVDPSGRRADRVRWNDGRSFPDPTGASMSVVDPAGDNASSTNWCTSATPFGRGDLGTPGDANECTKPSGEVGPPVVITEILRNPSAVGDSIGEWFEVYNPNGASIDLQGWIIRDNDTNYHVIDRSVVVPAGGYAVLGKSADNPGRPHDYIYDDVILHNSHDELVLVNANGAIVDQVDWDNVTFPSPSGASMALRNNSANNHAGENWCTSATPMAHGDLATPGADNVCDDEGSDATLIISEMMINPSASYDSAGEWFEVHNWGPIGVDMNGFIIKDEDFNEFVVNSSLEVPAGGYAVFGRYADPALNGGAELDYVYGADMSLINSGDELVILDATRRVVDQVAWGSGTGFVVPSGASLQVIDPAAANDAPGAWCQALMYMFSDDTGTPGTANTCEAPDDENYNPDFDDRRCRRNQPNAIIGTRGDDVIHGTAGNDIIISLQGRDTIISGGGNDIICAGPGADVIDAGAGNDIIIGNRGDDTIEAGSGDDLVAAGRGDDWVNGGPGNDSITLGNGNDIAHGGTGDDKITGNRGVDSVDGGTGNDHCDKAEQTTSCEF